MLLSRKTLGNLRLDRSPKLALFGAVFTLCTVSFPIVAQADSDTMAMRWWNSLNGEQMVAALYGDVATEAQEMAAKKMYDDLDDATKMMVDKATAEIYGMGGHRSVGAWWETLDCRKMRIAAGDGNMADSSSAFCAHYPGSGSAKILGEMALAHVNKVGMALLGRDDAGVYPANSSVAMRWWNVLNGEQMVAAIYGDMATAAQEMAAKMMYANLDPERRRLVNAAAAEIYGDGDFASVGVWWETLDCRKMRIATGDGNMADPSSAFCAHYPGSGSAKILEEMPLAHVNKVGMGMLGRTMPGAYPTMYTIPFFPTATDVPGRQGFARVVNRGGRAVTVDIMAYNSAGMGYGPAQLMIGANSAANFSAEDLAMGNADVGLSNGLGIHDGPYRLVLTSTLPLKATGFMKMDDGFFTSLQDVVPYHMTGHLVNIFHPASNIEQVSWLRVVNPGDSMAYVNITGTDDSGAMGSKTVSFTVMAGGAKMLSARSLESGTDMMGGLGMGMGKWRLRVTSPQHILVQSLVDTSAGHMSNVSTAMNH